MSHFFKLNSAQIAAVVIPKAMISRDLKATFEAMCDVNQVVSEHFVEIYAEIFINEKDPKILAKCEAYFEQAMKKTIKERLQYNTKKVLEETLVYYNKSPTFVMKVMELMWDGADTDEIRKNISGKLLGVLFYFDILLSSPNCERSMKKYILLSLGDLIRFLGSDYISATCFKIIQLLKAAVAQTDLDLSEQCIQVWDILIRICDVSSLGPFLSTIFVSLEVFIDKFPEKVDEIFKYLIVDNASLLGRHVPDLFFIKKTRVNEQIKLAVLHLIDSQKTSEVDFRSKLQSLMNLCDKENSDLKIRVYCIQYITELFQSHRTELNEMICGRMSMDPIIENLLHILVSNCKTTSESLQLATAECLGELGAIEPSLQQQNYASQKEFPKTIHCEEFATMALKQLCRSYQYKTDSKYIDALSLAIQRILSSSNVKMENRHKHPVWLAIPENMRTPLESFITSLYVPKQTQPCSHPIFPQTAQTPSEWSMLWAGALIVNIPSGETRLLLESLKPSMKHDQHTTSMFLPYMLLHSLELSDESTHDKIFQEIKSVFDVLMENVNEDRTNDMKPLYVKQYNFNPIAFEEKMKIDDIRTNATKIGKMIFEVFDFLENFTRTNTNKPELNVIVSNLLNRFDLEEMATINYKCEEYARALIYLEAKMKDDKMKGEDQQKHLPFLGRIFAKLGSTDAIQGVQALKTSEWSLKEKVLLTNITGNHQESVGNCERMLQTGDATIEHVKSLVNSYIALDQPETAIMVYEKMMRQLENSHQQLSDEIKAEPLWRLSRFDELDALLAEDDISQSTSWGVQCGKMLLKFRAGDDGFFSDSRLALMKNLKISGSEQTAYGKNYSEIINLHLITEFEKTEKALEEIKKSPMKSEATQILQKLIDEWNVRMEFVEKNGAIEEPILGLHRIILNETKSRLQRIVDGDEMEKLNAVIDGAICNLWMQSTKLAFKNKMFDQAQTYILNAETYQPKVLFLEKAKLSWLKEDQDGAFKILEMGVKKILGNHKDETKLSDEDKKIYSKGKMMIARYNAEAINVEFETNKKLFIDAIVKGAENEKLFLLTADYMDLHYFKEGEQPKLSEIMEVMKHYLRSMCYGNEFVFQSMPRFLTIWLDSTADVNRPKNEVLAINKIAESACDKLSPYFFYTAMSQLISRICHPQDETFRVLKKILTKLINSHPDQSLWYMVPMMKSTNLDRVKRCKEILHECVKKKDLILNFNILIDKFIKLSTLETRGEKVLSIKNVLPDLKTFLESKATKPISIPFQSNIQLMRVQNTFQFNNNIATIYKIKDNVDIMASLQKPRKVMIIGSDGKQYPALLKKNDDCRIDQRFMEFSSVLKQFLHKDPAARRAQLTTRTYGVIPLSESAGFIGEFPFKILFVSMAQYFISEWVPNLQTYKEIIMSQYRKKRHSVPGMNTLSNLNIEKKNKEAQVAEYRRLIQVFYPALGDYFRQQFPSPQNYFKARSAFIKSTAVWSIIGYIMVSCIASSIKVFAHFFFFQSF